MTASGPASPNTAALRKIPPFAYQLTETFGTEPVCGSNFPLNEKCGSLLTVTFTCAVYVLAQRERAELILDAADAAADAALDSERFILPIDEFAALAAR